MKQLFILAGILGIISLFLPNNETPTAVAVGESLVSAGNIHFITPADAEICLIPEKEQQVDITPIVEDLIEKNLEKENSLKIDGKFLQQWVDTYAPKMEEQERRFIARFMEVAFLEKEKYSIPITIKLSQGLLESGAGTSKLARQTNNYFGIKWYRGYYGEELKGMNLHDDKPTDIFCKYPNAWTSFRHHSKFLQRQNYKNLPWSDIYDYEKWAYEIKKSGYATDKRYPQKLISKIEDFGLDFLELLTHEEILELQKMLKNA
jgi:flagellum-specific peptidoglycan hydrolase FlgJ